MAEEQLLTPNEAGRANSRGAFQSATVGNSFFYFALHRFGDKTTRLRVADVVVDHEVSCSYDFWCSRKYLFCTPGWNAVQFIEKNSLNVRSAVYHLKKDGAGLEFLLFPMIHVGSKEFYNEISRRLAGCDLILAEGVNSKNANLLTLSYRIVKKIRRMDLITQQEGMAVSRLRDKIVNSDMDGRAFDEHWSALPFSLKSQLIFFIPVYVVYLFLFGTRKTIAENIALEDLPSSDEVLFQGESLEHLDALLIDERDRRLIDSIGKLNDAARQDKKTVGVVYGAMHMRNVIGFLLHKLNYRVAKAEWVTVFDL